MILKATAVRYSSVVGGGLALKDEKGAAVYFINIWGTSHTSHGVTKEVNDQISEQLAGMINHAGGIRIDD